MSEFPKWLLALAGLSLIPLWCCPLFLFGGMPFGTSDNSFVRFLLYIATQLLWLAPIATFFIGLDLWRRGYKRRGVAVNVLGLILSVLAFVLLFL